MRKHERFLEKPQIRGKAAKLMPRLPACISLMRLTSQLTYTCTLGAMDYDEWQIRKAAALAEVPRTKDSRKWWEFIDDVDAYFSRLINRKTKLCRNRCN